MLFDFSHLFHQSDSQKPWPHIVKQSGTMMGKRKQIQLFRQFAFLFKGLTKYLNMTMHIIYKQKAQSESPERLQRPI